MLRRRNNTDCAVEKEGGCCACGGRLGGLCFSRKDEYGVSKREIRKNVLWWEKDGYRANEGKVGVCAEDLEVEGREDEVVMSGMKRRRWFKRGGAGI